MIVVLAVQVLVLLAVVLILTRNHAQRETAWTVERRELLTRVQRPDFIPTSHEPFDFPDVEDDEIGLVGTIADPPEDS